MTYRLVYTWDGTALLHRDFATRREADLWREFVEDMCRESGRGDVRVPPRPVEVS